MAKRISTNEVRLEGPITLDDLRWLVEVTSTANGSSKVELKEARSLMPTDGNPDTLICRALSPTEVP